MITTFLKFICIIEADIILMIDQEKHQIEYFSGFFKVFFPKEIVETPFKTLEEIPIVDINKREIKLPQSKEDRIFLISKNLKNDLKTINKL